MRGMKMKNLRTTAAMWVAATLFLAAASGVHAETVVSLTQVSYDGEGHVQCTAVRMNPVIYSSLPTDACTLGSPGTSGPDRISKNVYDAVGHLIEIKRALGVTTPTPALEQIYATYTYTANGMKASESDARGNVTRLVYNGNDRLITVDYPNTSTSHSLQPCAATPETYTGPSGCSSAQSFTTRASGDATKPLVGAYSTTDYESFNYDAAGNQTHWRRRSGAIIDTCYDALNRTVITYAHADTTTCTGTTSGNSADVYTTYDGLGRIAQKAFSSFTGTGLSNGGGILYSYGSLGEMLSATDTYGRSLSYTYNSALVRATMTFPDGAAVNFDRDNLDRLTVAHLTSDSSILYSQTYDNLGNRLKLIRAAGPNSSACATKETCFTYDTLGRMTSMTDRFNVIGTSVTWTFGDRNPAGQLTTWSSTNAMYDYMQKVTSTESRTYDGLNRDSSIAGTTGGYDANGNLTCDGSRRMTYDVFNRLLTVANVPSCTGTATSTEVLDYDPEGRLARYSIDGGTTWTQFVYDGSDLVIEYNDLGHMTERYLHGEGTDDPIVWFHGATTGLLRYFYTNHQGSVIARGSAGGVMDDATRYGAYGEPEDISGDANWSVLSRFRYTGQTALPEAHLYYYKARVYDPAFGRFMQTDPIGSKDDIDLYAYVGGDPINRSDPSGLQEAATGHISSHASTTADFGIAYTTRQADGSYVAPTGPGSPIGNIIAAGGRAKSVIGNGQCVTACKFFSGITAPTKDWRFGEAAANNPSLAIGTAIATMDPSTERYPIGDVDKNSGIYMGPGKTPGSIRILDQWAAHPSIPGPAGLPHPPQIREMSYNSNYGVSNSASAYHVINVPDSSGGD